MGDGDYGGLNRGWDKTEIFGNEIVPLKNITLLFYEMLTKYWRMHNEY